MTSNRPLVDWCRAVELICSRAPQTRLAILKLWFPVHLLTGTDCSARSGMMLQSRMRHMSHHASTLAKPSSTFIVYSFQVAVHVHITPWHLRGTYDPGGRHWNNLNSSTATVNPSRPLVFDKHEVFKHRIGRDDPSASASNRKLPAASPAHPALPAPPVPD